MRRLALAKRLYRRWCAPLFDPAKAFRWIRAYPGYVRDWSRYSGMAGAEPLRLADGYPRLVDQGTATSYDPHYFYQAVWAMERIAKLRASYHIDVGSDVRFVAMLTTHLPVVFVDIRPLYAAGIDHLASAAGSLLGLPFANRSVESLSCLHVAEHVGLGRYGDPLDPNGTRRACAELARVLAPGGQLYFSVPVGRPRVCFNAHRIHSPGQIIGYFPNLRLMEFAAVDDGGHLLTNILPHQMDLSEYGCGLFRFQC